MKDKIIDCIIETLQGEGGTVEWDNIILEYKKNNIYGILDIKLSFWHEYFVFKSKRDFKIKLSKEQVKNQVIKRLFKGE